MMNKRNKNDAKVCVSNAAFIVFETHAFVLVYLLMMNNLDC